MWKTVPIVVVITKSYSVPERIQNIKMVKDAFAMQKRYSKNLKHIVPVVASIYTLNDSAFAAPEGITELIDVTNALMPEGIKAGANDVYKFKLKRKKALAQSIVAVSTTAAVSVGAITIRFADALILSPIEVGQINALARLYEIDNSMESKQLIKSIVEVGTVSTAAKAVISALKAIPGINIAERMLNSIIAGAIVAAIGESSIYVFEKVYTGEKSVEDIEWVKKIMEAKLSPQFIDRVITIVEKISKSDNTKDTGKLISSLLSMVFTTKAQKEI